MILETISADHFNVPITVSKPKITLSNLSQISEAWIAKQGKHWPPELTGNILIEKIKTVFIPYWVVGGDGTAQWTARIGQTIQKQQKCGRCYGRGIVRPSENNVMNVDSGELVTCTQCAGSGMEVVNDVQYNQQNGYVQVKVDGQIFENLSSTIVLPKLQRQDIQTTEVVLLPTELSNILVLRPQSTLLSVGYELAQQSIETALQLKALESSKNLGRVKDIELVNQRFSNLQARIWLYPIYQGLYVYEDDDQPYSILIDGNTGELYADTPKSVKDARIKDAIVYGVFSILALISISFVIFYLVYR